MVERALPRTAVLKADCCSVMYGLIQGLGLTGIPSDPTKMGRRFASRPGFTSGGTAGATGKAPRNWACACGTGSPSRVRPPRAAAPNHLAEETMASLQEAGWKLFAPLTRESPAPAAD